MKIKFTLLFFAFALCLCKPVVLKAQVNIQDSLALVDLYNSTNGDFWNHNKRWLVDPVATWYGITVADTRVTGINLQNNKLRGKIPASIGDLDSLESLLLLNNSLNGRLPSEIGKLKKLTLFNLSHNHFVGPIPIEFGNLKHLNWLYLEFNDLSGSIPSSIGMLLNLIYLDLSNNALSGNIPPSIGKLANLTSLALSQNALTGSIPNEIGNLINLGGIALDYNQLTGRIPKTFGNISNLSYLQLNNNQLSGSIPVEIGKLLNLTFLYISNNQLTGKIPSVIGNLVKLTTCGLNNNQLSGTIPPEIGNLVSLPVLELNNNRLDGSIPFEIGNLVNLYTLNLSFNNLSGNIPSSIGNLFNQGLGGYNALYLNNNRLTGSIPPEIGKLANLFELRLNNNQLSGDIPASITNLVHCNFDLSNNRFTFAGMEPIALNFPYANKYDNQAHIPTSIHDNTLSVSAGGTLTNNSYKWYMLGQSGSTQIDGDSVFHPTVSGTYYARIANSICTQLILRSDTITYTVQAALNNSIASSANELQRKEANQFIVYPNPVKDVLHIQSNSNASYSLVNEAGKILLTKNINGKGSINVSGIAAGLYYLKNNSNGAVQKVAVTR